ncbi:uncharacterized protein LOC62_05G007252 [Vanrija pseudolonga]|uniref:Uncharacterized protein n=1 Tax=Vanrija pseudolonga TaxID=143232 RepID=A0AAF0YFN2_9TREE|nr:hypothetical protein LOC62_05G007252 [Vanrija pseudolonga]
MLVSTLVLGLGLFLVALPVFIVFLRRYDRRTRDILADAVPDDINKPWKGYEMAPAPPGRPKSGKAAVAAAAAAAAPLLLAKPAAAAPTTYSLSTTTLWPDVTLTLDDDVYYDLWYKPDRDAATRKIHALTIALPVVVGVPLLLMAGLALNAYLRHRRAKIVARPKVEYWGVN